MEPLIVGAINLSAMPDYPDNTVGNWCMMTVTVDGITESFITSFVRDSDGVVKMYGDRVPFRSGGHVDVQAVQQIDPNGTKMWSGLNFHFRDEGNVALDSGIDAVLILHPSLPEMTLVDGTVVNGVLSRRFELSTEYKIIVPELQYWSNSLSEEDGLDIAKINAGDRFTFIGLDRFDDTTWALLPPASRKAKSFWIDVITARPIATSALTAAHFPTITSPVLTNLADVTIPGDVVLSWTMPTAITGAIAGWAGISWGDNINSEHRSVSLWDTPGVTTTTFDTSSTTVSPTGHFNMSVKVEDPVTWQDFTTNITVW
jgi:hypothetical protein